MTTAVSVYPAYKPLIATGGTPVIAAFSGSLGGIIVNPLLAVDQGISAAETLYVSICATPAGTTETATTFALLPGQQFTIPANLTTNVTVNAVTSGHRFSAYVVNAQQVFPPTPNDDTFPPAANTSLTQVIAAYLYEEYNDDEDLQAFFAAFNMLAQNYITQLSSLGLPVYTGAPIQGNLLDWVATGLYGYPRPVLSTGTKRSIGPLNTYAYNTFPLNTRKTRSNATYYATSDDTYKRCLTWHFYKGDGKVFNVRWLKRRVMRFLNGVNGTSYNVDQTYQISVTFGPGNQVNINILSAVSRVTGGALFGSLVFGTYAFAQLKLSIMPFAPLQSAAVLQQAIESGALELPFQYTYVVNVG